MNKIKEWLKRGITALTAVMAIGGTTVALDVDAQAAEVPVEKGYMNTITHADGATHHHEAIMEFTDGAKITAVFAGYHQPNQYVENFRVVGINPIGIDVMDASGKHFEGGDGVDHYIYWNDWNKVQQDPAIEAVDGKEWEFTMGSLKLHLRNVGNQDGKYSLSVFGGVPEADFKFGLIDANGNEYMVPGVAPTIDGEAIELTSRKNNALKNQFFAEQPKVTSYSVDDRNGWFEVGVEHRTNNSYVFFTRKGEEPTLAEALVSGQLSDENRAFNYDPTRMDLYLMTLGDETTAPYITPVDTSMVPKSLLEIRSLQTTPINVDAQENKIKYNKETGDFEIPLNITGGNGTGSYWISLTSGGDECWSEPEPNHHMSDGCGITQRHNQDGSTSYFATIDDQHVRFRNGKIVIPEMKFSVGRYGDGVYAPSSMDENGLQNKRQEVTLKPVSLSMYQVKGFGGAQRPAVAVHKPHGVGTQFRK